MHNNPHFFVVYFSDTFTKCKEKTDRWGATGVIKRLSLPKRQILEDGVINSYQLLSTSNAVRVL